MYGKDPVMVDLDRYLTTLEEDYVDPFEAKREYDEWRADNEPDVYED
jgi:hypothetical protein